jgi:hypothetical protein
MNSETKKEKKEKRERSGQIPEGDQAAIGNGVLDLDRREWKRMWLTLNFSCFCADYFNRVLLRALLTLGHGEQETCSRKTKKMGGERRCV